MLCQSVHDSISRPFLRAMRWKPVSEFDQSNYWLKSLSFRGKMTHVDANSSDQVNLPLAFPQPRSLDRPRYLGRLQYSQIVVVHYALFLHRSGTTLLLLAKSQWEIYFAGVPAGMYSQTGQGTRSALPLVHYWAQKRGLTPNKLYTVFFLVSSVSIKNCSYL